jgi:hypothetical protein
MKDEIPSFDGCRILHEVVLINDARGQTVSNASLITMTELCSRKKSKPVGTIMTGIFPWRKDAPLISIKDPSFRSCILISNDVSVPPHGLRFLWQVVIL